MPEPEKTYLLTFRHDSTPPNDWQAKLTSIPGITLIANTGRHARITATPEAIDALTANLGEGLILEEEMPRYF